MIGVGGVFRIELLCAVRIVALLDPVILNFHDGVEVLSRAERY